MSSFNIVRGSSSCPNCNRSADFEVQFKYGDTWQHCYRLGDRLRWSGNDIGSPGRKRVIVEGIGGPCPHCHAIYLDFDIVLLNDELVGIEPVLGPRTASGPEGFVVLEP
jgi:hypothetical protein